MCMSVWSEDVGIDSEAHCEKLRIKDGGKIIQMAVTAGKYLIMAFLLGFHSIAVEEEMFLQITWMLLFWQNMHLI